jgi:peptide/nickel transport system substrate-binding protein
MPALTTTTSHCSETASDPINALSTPNKETGAGAYNRGRYSNRDLDALAAKAMATLDDNAREKVL